MRSEFRRFALFIGLVCLMVYLYPEPVQHVYVEQQ